MFGGSRLPGIPFRGPWFRLPFGVFGAVRSFCGPVVPLSLFRPSGCLPGGIASGCRLPLSSFAAVPGFGPWFSGDSLPGFRSRLLLASIGRKRAGSNAGGLLFAFGPSGPFGAVWGRLAGPGCLAAGCGPSVTGCMCLIPSSCPASPGRHPDAVNRSRWHPDARTQKRQVLSGLPSLGGG